MACNHLASLYYILFYPAQNSKTRYRRNIYYLAVEDKNIYFVFFFWKITAMVVKWLY